MIAIFLPRHRQKRRVSFRLVREYRWPEYVKSTYDRLDALKSISIRCVSCMQEMLATQRHIVVFLRIGQILLFCRNCLFEQLKMIYLISFLLETTVVCSLSTSFGAVREYRSSYDDLFDVGKVGVCRVFIIGKDNLFYRIQLFLSCSCVR